MRVTDIESGGAGRGSGHLAGAPNIGAEYEIVVYDKDGNEKRRFGGKANCFVKGFMDYLWHLARNGGGEYAGSRTTTEFKDTGGTPRVSYLDAQGSSAYHVGGVRANGGADATTTGIVCGTSDAETGLGNYEVGGLIGTGVLEYGSTVVSPLTYVGSTATLQISRQVVASRAVPIEGIRAIALYARGVGVAWSVMLLRDMIPQVDLDVGEGLAIVYKMVFNGGQ